jgi:integrase
MGRKRLHKRANGEGSAYYRECDGRWAAEVTVGYDERGRQIKQRVYAKTQAEVLNKLDEMRSRVAQGLPARPQRQTTGQFLNRWLNEVACYPRIGRKAATTYRDLMEDHVLPLLGPIELTKLGPEDVERLVTHILNTLKPSRKKNSDDPSRERYSVTTAKHCRDVLRAALNVAVRWGLISRNPAALVIIKRPRRTPTFFDQRQAVAFLEAIYGERLEALFWLAVCLGCREGEILGLQWTDIDFESGKVQIARSLQRIKSPGDSKSHLELIPTKTEESDRSIWLPQIVIEKVLQQQRRQQEERKLAGSEWVETGMVFTTRKGTMLDARNMLEDFYRIRDRAKLPPVRFHDLRHSAATILHLAGVPDQAIQKLLGHASVRTTQEIYMHLTADAQKQTAAKMDELFGPVAVTVAVKQARTKPS